MSSVYGLTSIVGEDLQRRFASPKLTVEEVTELMEQYLRLDHGVLHSTC